MKDIKKKFIKDELKMLEEDIKEARSIILGPNGRGRRPIDTTRKHLLGHIDTIKRVLEEL